MPEGVLLVIARRLSGLTGACRQTLTIASVIGRDFDFNLLNKLESGFGEEHLLEVIEEAYGSPYS